MECTHLGKQVAAFYQALAVELNLEKEDYFKQRDEIIRTYKKQGRRSEIQYLRDQYDRICCIPYDS